MQEEKKKKRKARRGLPGEANQEGRREEATNRSQLSWAGEWLHLQKAPAGWCSVRPVQPYIAALRSTNLTQKPPEIDFGNIRSNQA